MLESMRSIAHGLVAKALLMFLVITFAIWGIGDILRTSHGDYVATIGGQKISVPEFQHEVGSMKRALEAQGLGNVDNAMLTGQVLRQMLMERLTELHMHDLGLSVGDKTLVERLRAAQAFQNADGRFDSTRFRAMLQQRGMSEEGFLAQLKSDIQSHVLMDSIDTADITLPPSVLAMQALAAGETRDAAVVTIPVSSVTAKAPGDKDLKDYYDQQKEILYLEPEHRTLEYVTLTAGDISALVDKEITDKVLQERFVAEKARFARPEQRHVLQLLVTDSAEADKAKAQWKPGMTLADIKASAPHAKQTDLGIVAEDKLPSSAASVIFNAKNGEVVGPVTTDFGQAFYQITAIQPPGQADFDKAKPALTAELRDEARDHVMQELTNQVEDTLAAGKSMHDALAAAGVKTESRLLKNVTQASAAGGADALVAAVTAQGFSLNEGETSTLNVAKNGTYFMVSVKAVTPAAPKKFDDVRADVEKRLKSEAASDAVSERAGTLVAALHKNKDWSAVLTAQHVISRPVTDIPRGKEGAAKGIPGPLAQALFEHAPGEVAGPFTLPNGDAMIAIVTNIRHNPQAKLSDASRKQMATALGDEVVQHYFDSLAERYPVDVNRPLLTSIAKGGNNDD